MIPWVHLGTAVVPGDGGELRLMQRGTEFSIMSGAIELMSSRLSGSEKALATLPCERLKDRPRPHFLIGGFGMGFTLRAALENLGPSAQVTVGELVPEIIDWARGPMAHMSGECLKDPRVTIALGDVGDLIRAGRESYDAILLDVDNGPEGLSRAENDRLYSDSGLAAARRALRPGGILAVWSSARDERFTKRLRKAGYDAEEVGVRATGGKRGARHVIWMATVPAKG